MLETVHFISGLPRSGSTLLSALLRQNPRFHTDITGPVAVLAGIIHQRIGGTGEFAVMFDDVRRAQMLHGLFDTYYAHVPVGHVVFDTNRSWTSRSALLATLYPRSRIICCVREIGWIIDSLERMRAKNPLKVSKLFGEQPGDTVYKRVDALMNSDNGLIGQAWCGLREAWFSDCAHKLMVVPYDSLVRQPEATLKRLYQELGEPWFSHDFNNVAYEAPDYDDNLGLPGLHTVHRVVEPRTRRPAIPPDLFAKYDKTHFWGRTELNPSNVVVL